MWPFGSHSIVKDIKLKEDINEKGKCTFLKLVSRKLNLKMLEYWFSRLQAKENKKSRMFAKLLKSKNFSYNSV